MKTAGLIGGMSWQSTLTYYRLMNEGVSERLGGQHSAQLLLASVDFAPIEALQATGDWQAAGELLGRIARQLEGAGAEFIVLCTNTMHKVAGDIEAAVSIPLLPITTPTIAACKAADRRRVGLLGTRFTMEDDFCRKKLESAGIEVIVPEASERESVHRIIYDELCHGRVLDASRTAVQKVIASLAFAGADAVVLGCTELGLLQPKSPLPLLDTTALHAQAAVEYALG